MDDARLEFGSLYLTRFASSFGYVTVLTLLPTYIELLDPSGLVIGLFTTALTVASTIAVVPLGWAGDRYDKRTVLLVATGVSAVAYLLFAGVNSSLGFVAARFLQGIGLVGTGLLSLALIGELAPVDERANHIGRYNAWRMAAGVAGTLGAGALYQLAGFIPVFALIGGLLVVALLGVHRFLEPDGTSIEGFAFADLAVNRRILTLTSFRAQYAVAVTLVRTWVPIYAGVSAARGGLALGAFAVGVVLAAEKAANGLFQPRTGRLSDRYGRALFVFAGGTGYGLVALAIPAAPMVAAGVPDLPAGVPAVLVALVGLNALLGVADAFREPASMALFADEGAGEGIASSFGIRSIVWRPGSIVAPMIGGVLMTDVGMAWVFYVGGAFALTGVATFLGVLSRSHGPRALTEW